MNFSSDQLTSLEATIVNDYIVILVGTADGKIKKVIYRFRIGNISVCKYHRLYNNCFSSYYEAYSYSNISSWKSLD